MIRIRRATLLLVLGLVTLTPFTGCGPPKPITIKGKLTKAGQPYTVSKDTLLTIAFYAMDAETTDTTTHTAKFEQETGNFEVTVVPGKYKVSVLVAGSDPVRKTTLPPKTVANKDDPKMQFDLKSNNQEITIDVPK